MPADVLEETPNRADCGDDSPYMRPKVPLVFHASSLSGGREGLAGITSNDAIHASTPLFAVEGLEIRPHRRSIQDPATHRRDQNFAAEGFDLHITDRSSRGNSQLDSEIEHSRS